MYQGVQKYNKLPADFKNENSRFYDSRRNAMTSVLIFKQPYFIYNVFNILT